LFLQVECALVSLDINIVEGWVAWAKWDDKPLYGSSILYGT